MDKPFLYIIPDELVSQIKTGDKVMVPFGKNNKDIEGFVIFIFCDDDINSNKFNIDENYKELIKNNYNLKKINNKVDKKISVDSILLNIAIYMHKEYLTPLIQCLKTVLHVKKELKPNKNRVDVLNNYKKINKNILLNDEQQNIYDILYRFYKLNKYSNHLIYGIIGSGKTEIYIKLIEDVINDDKQVIVLIPEISLTYQTVTRLKEKFDNNIAIIHTKITEGEKYIQIKKCINKQVNILVGPRSAVFGPFDNLGLIVMDEEDDKSYKSDKAPRYNTRDIAIYRSKLQNFMFLSLSATPRIISYNNAKDNVKDSNNNSKDNKEFHLYILRNRAKVKLPKLYIVDLCKEFKIGSKTMFSNLLIEKINDRLKKKEQVMLFMNRRGLNKVMTCISCGKTFKCPNCDITLTLHNDGFLKCHYCGYEERVPLLCPECQGNKFVHFGIGTQQLEENVIKAFPQARVLRMDKDTTKIKDGYDIIINKFKNNEADILLGTQMIVKGHDFPNVTLVGVICADMSFNIQNYKSTEDSFSLLSQVIGRSGREKNGECIIQTYDINNVVVDLIKDNNYEKFFEYEIKFRQKYRYPPFYCLLIIHLKCENEIDLEYACKYLKYKLNEINNIKSSGPIIPFPSKIKNNYYRLFYIKANDYEYLKIIRYKCNEFIKSNNKYKNITLFFDIEK